MAGLRPFATKLAMLARNASAILANALVLAVLAWFGYLHETDSDAYYLAVQEDAPMEWATFAAFALAALLHAYEARRRRDHTLSFLFLMGLALFCFLFAGEEISWGQRVAGYQSPEYFLANNYQQELNFHNVIPTDLRKLVLQAIMLGYGVLLPLLALFKTPRAQLDKFGVVCPPAAMAPSFAACFALHFWYPWSYCGEVSEMMLALSFLFSPILRLTGASKPLPELNRQWIRPFLVADAWIVSFALGVTASASLLDPTATDPFAQQQTEAEIQALEKDLASILEQSKRPGWSKDSSHRRLFTLVEEEDVPQLQSGRFAMTATAQGDEDRATFLIDPWNSPYWARIRPRSRTRETVITLYSFGPNRRRDSTRTELRGDDIGTVIKLH